MSVRVANAPCSWGVELADDPRNPAWRQVIKENAEAGYEGIELGPVGYMPENSGSLADALDEFGQDLVGGILYRPFFDPASWENVWDGALRTSKVLQAHGAQHLVLIDSRSHRRMATVGRASEAVQMDKADWNRFVNAFREVAKLGTEGYGLTVSIHAHAAVFMDFEPELERLLDEVAPVLLKICLDTGHHLLGGYDPVAFMERDLERVAYIHLKDTNPSVKRRVIENRTWFNEACADGLFCRLGQGDVDLSAVRQLIAESGYAGWCTVEQECNPTGPSTPFENAVENRKYLASIGL